MTQMISLWPSLNIIYFSKPKVGSLSVLSLHLPSMQLIPWVGGGHAPPNTWCLCTGFPDPTGGSQEWRLSPGAPGVPWWLLTREAAYPATCSIVLALLLLPVLELVGASFPSFLIHMTFMGRNFPDSCLHRFFRDKRCCSLLFL